MTRAPLATAQRIAFASASTGIDRCGPTTFAIEQLGGRRQARDPDAVVRLRGDQAGHERSVALRVDGGGPGDEALRGGDPAAQLGMGAVDTRVDHRDPHGGERRQLGPGVERTVLGRVPLPRQERIVRHERRSPAPQRARRTARPATPRSAAARGAETASAGIGREVDDARRAARPQPLRRPRRGRRPARCRRRTGPHPPSSATARPSAATPASGRCPRVTSAASRGTR